MSTPEVTEDDREKDQPIEERAVDDSGAGITITRYPEPKRPADL